MDDVIFIPGDDEAFRGQACITSDTRPFPRHIWFRAMMHVWMIKEESWDVREQAIRSILQHMTRIPPDDPEKMLKPPQFSWKGIPGKL